MRKDQKHRSVFRKVLWRTQREDGQAQEKGLRRNWSCLHLGLGLPASRTVRTKLCCLSGLGCGLLWQP